MCLVRVEAKYLFHQYFKYAPRLSVYDSVSVYLCTIAVIDFLPVELKLRFLQIKDMDERSQGSHNVACAVMTI